MAKYHHRLLAVFLVSAAGLTCALAETLEPMARPEDVGLSHARLLQIEATLTADIDKGRIPGAVLAIARKGQLAYLRAFGYRDRAANAAMSTDALFSIASMTKPFVSVAAMMLVEEGRLSLDDPVDKHLPALQHMKVGSVRGEGANATIEVVPAHRPMTIRDLLRHTSGLTSGARARTEIQKMYPESSKGGALQTSSEFLHQISKAYLMHQPGTVFEYGVSTDVLGLVVEAVTGKELGAFLEHRLFKPLKMTDTGFAVEAGKRARYAMPLPTDPESKRPQTVLHATEQPLKFQCGGACAVSTASDYVRFLQMLLGGGLSGATRLLKSETVALMTMDHLGRDIRAATPTNFLAEIFGFGLGFAIRQEGHSSWIGTPGDYSWAGSSGSYFWVDPKNQLVVVYMAHTPNLRTSLQYWKLLRSEVTAAVLD